MNKIDEFGSDPNVQIMRRIFAKIEESQKIIIRTLDISPIDPRLRKWREIARDEYERSFHERIRRGGPINDNEASTIYIDCFVKVLIQDGIDISIEKMESIGKGEGDS